MAWPESWMSLLSPEGSRTAGGNMRSSDSQYSAIEQRSLRRPTGSCANDQRHSNSATRAACSAGPGQRTSVSAIILRVATTLAHLEI